MVWLPPAHQFDMSTILAGDIGGTNARFGLYSVQDNGLQPLVRAVYPCRDFNGLEEILQQFRALHPVAVQAATVGVAGPVLSGRVVTPNLPWTVEAASLAHLAGVSSLGLINDLVANAYGAATLTPADLATLQAGEEDPMGHACIISAGTGLGQAGFFFDGTFRRPMPSEGGHADFAPQNPQEVDLFLFLRERLGHVSYERVLSGPGLVNIYEFLTFVSRGAEPLGLRLELDSAAAALAAGTGTAGAAAAAISKAALADAGSRAGMAMDQFVAIYGAAAGNLALMFKATGGVFIGGGIAPQILSRLQGETFLRAFHDKGRLQPLLEKIPIQVILNDDCALMGAALHAALSIGEMSGSWIR